MEGGIKKSKGSRSRGQTTNGVGGGSTKPSL